MLKKIILATALSIVVFFAVSFLSILLQIPPFVSDYYGWGHIGFPFEYYYQFYVQGNINHGWNPINLLFDCTITWIVVALLYLYFKRKK